MAIYTFLGKPMLTHSLLHVLLLSHSYTMSDINSSLLQAAAPPPPPGGTCLDALTMPLVDVAKQFVGETFY